MASTSQDQSDLVEERLARVIAGEIERLMESHMPLSVYPGFIADEIARGFRVQLREPDSGSYGPDPSLPQRPITLA